MSDLFTDIFGGSNTSTTSSSTPSNQNPFTAALTPTVLNAATTPAPQYTGPLSAPASSQETALLGQLPASGSGTATTNYLNNVLSGSYMPGGANGNPFINQSIAAVNQPILNNLQNTLTTSLPGQFTAAGQMTGPQGSSAFDRAAALQTTQAAQAMTAADTNIENNAYNTGVQQETAAVPLAQQEVQTTIASLQAAALPRLIQQLGIQNGLSAFQSNASTLMQFLSTIGSIAQPIIANTQVSNSDTSSTPGILPDVSGLISANKSSNS